MSAHLRKRFIRLVCIVVVVWALGSCGTVKFYTQAAQGQWEILHKARLIDEVIADAKSEGALKRKLQLVLELREYAKRELHLPVDEKFKDYTDLGRKHVVWVVFAAPEFSVEAKTWWYPLVGSLKYRGFFSEQEAKAEGAQLKAQGFDVFVGGTDAYSTLGWFNDPVLNTFIFREDAELAELLFHELTHSRIFISGDTDFNEALATAYAQSCVRKWLASNGLSAELTKYEQDNAKNDEIIHLLLHTRDELKSVYATRTDKSAAKEECIAAMLKSYALIKQRWTGDSRYDRFFTTKMNNAQLNTMATYYDLVPGFTRMLSECGGDAEKFFAKLEAMKPMAREQRRALVKGGSLQ